MIYKYAINMRMNVTILEELFFCWKGGLSQQARAIIIVGRRLNQGIVLSAKKKIYSSLKVDPIVSSTRSFYNQDWCLKNKVYVSILLEEYTYIFVPTVYKL